MKFLVTIFTLFFCTINAQDRSLIFTTGAPSGTCTSTSNPCNTDADCTLGNLCELPAHHTINNTYSLSDRIYAEQNMALEALKIYAEAISETANVKVVLNADENGIPGEEIFSWDIDVVQENHGNNYFLIITTDECLYLDEGNYYWITLHAMDTATEIAWYYSNNSTFTYSTSTDLGSIWESSMVGNCGSLSVWAEYIYEPEVNDEVVGDLNTDGGVNVLDVVLLTNAILSGNSITGGDINDDGGLNVLDVVTLVNIVLNGSSQEQLSTWEYVDINPNSLFYDQLVGPSIFNGNVSIYYFGKAG